MLTYSVGQDYKINKSWHLNAKSDAFILFMNVFVATAPVWTVVVHAPLNQQPVLFNSSILHLFKVITQRECSVFKISQQQDKNGTCRMLGNSI